MQHWAFHSLNMETTEASVKSQDAAQQSVLGISSPATSYLLQPQTIPLPDPSQHIANIPQTLTSAGEKQVQKSGCVEQKSGKQRSQQNYTSSLLSLAGTSAVDSSKSRKNQGDTSGHHRQTLTIRQILERKQLALAQEQEQLRLSQLHSNKLDGTATDTASVTIHHFSDNPIRTTTNPKLINSSSLDVITKTKTNTDSFPSSTGSVSTHQLQKPVEALVCRQDIVHDAVDIHHQAHQRAYNERQKNVAFSNAGDGDKVFNSRHCDIDTNYTVCSLVLPQATISNCHLDLLTTGSNGEALKSPQSVHQGQNIASTPAQSIQLQKKDYPNVTQYLRPMSHVLPPLLSKAVSADMLLMTDNASASEKQLEDKTSFSNPEPSCVVDEPVGTVNQMQVPRDNCVKEQAISVTLSDIFSQKSIPEKDLSTGEVYKSALDGLSGDLIGVSEEDIRVIESMDRTSASVRDRELSHFSAVMGSQNINWSPHLSQTIPNIGQLKDSPMSHIATLPTFAGRLRDISSSTSVTANNEQLPSVGTEQTFGNADYQKLQVLGLSALSGAIPLQRMIEMNQTSSIAVTEVPLSSKQKSVINVQRQQVLVTPQINREDQSTVIESQINMPKTVNEISAATDTGTLPKFDTIRKTILPDPMEQIRQLRQASSCVSSVGSTEGSFMMLGTTSAMASSVSGTSSTETVFTSVSRLYGDSQLAQSRVHDDDQTLVNASRFTNLNFGQEDLGSQEPRSAFFQNSVSGNLGQEIPALTLPGSVLRPTSCPPSMNITVSHLENTFHNHQLGIKVSHQNNHQIGVKGGVDFVHRQDEVNINSSVLDSDQSNTFQNLNQSLCNTDTLTSNEDHSIRDTANTEMLDIPVQNTVARTNADVGNESVLGASLKSDFEAMLKQWFCSFPWLAFDIDSNKFHCSICLGGGMTSAIDRGKLEDSSNEFLLHENSEKHRDIVKSSLSAKLLSGIPDDQIHTDNLYKNTSKLIKISTQVITDHEKSVEQSTSIDVGHTQRDNEITHLNADRYLSRDTDNTSVLQKFKSSWFNAYTWLVLDIKKEELYCKICRHVGKKNIFSKGKSVSHPRRCEIHQHSTTIDHQDALTLYSSQNTNDRLLHKPENHHQTEQRLKEEKQTDDVPHPTVKNPKHSLRKKPNRNNKDVPLTDADFDQPILELPHDKRGPQKRRIQVHWFTDFPWLHFAPKTEVFYCTWCIKAENCNIFTSGKLSDNPKKDTFAKHEANSDHQIAAKKYAASTSENPEKEAVFRINLASDKSTSNDQTDDMDSAFAIPIKVARSSKVDVPRDKRGPLNRRIKPHWFAEYKWLTFDREKDKFFCKYCVNAEVDSILTKGKPADNPKKDTFAKHEATIDHQLAGQLYERLDAQGAFQKHKQTSYRTEQYGEENFASANREVITEEEKGCEPATRDEMVTEPDEESSQMSTDNQISAQQAVLTMDKSAECEATSNVESANLESSPWQLFFWGQASNLRRCGALCDITLSAMSSGGKIVQHKAHKLILVCASEYFKNLYMKNNLQDSYHFNNLTSKGLESVLAFMYGDNINGSQKIFSEAYEAAYILCIPKAKELFKHLLSLSGSGIFSPAKLQDVLQQTRAIESTANAFLDESNEASNDDSSNLQSFVKNIILPSLEDPLMSVDDASSDQQIPHPDFVSTDHEMCEDDDKFTVFDNKNCISEPNDQDESPPKKKKVPTATLR